MQMGVSVAIMQVVFSAVHYAHDCVCCCSYVVTSFCSTYAGDSSAANMWVTIFIVIMQMGVSVVIMQLVFPAVHYAHDCV